MIQVHVVRFWWVYTTNNSKTSSADCSIKECDCSIREYGSIFHNLINLVSISEGA